MQEVRGRREVAMSDDSKIHVDADRPATLNDGAGKLTDFATLPEAVAAWHALSAAQKAWAAVKVIGGPAYTAHQIDRLHFGKPQIGREVTAEHSSRDAADQMADDLTDLEIAVLCDLLQGPDVNLKAHKRVVLDRLASKGLLEPAKDRRSKFQLSDTAHRILGERGVGIGEG
jgi:hypothetical protein